MLTLDKQLAITSIGMGLLFSSACCFVSFCRGVTAKVEDKVISGDEVKIKLKWTAEDVHLCSGIKFFCYGTILLVVNRYL